jgi:hypothetical protein
MKCSNCGKPISKEECDATGGLCYDCEDVEP